MRRVPTGRARSLTACAAPQPPCAAAPGTLYLVSTPIGNALDITARAVCILGSVDVIAAEDTRRAGTLLKRVLPSRPAARLVSCHEHNWRTRAPALVARLAAGDSVAVVSDAGTPCVSDPGAELVAAAVGAGVPVVPVPGACAAVAALVAAALPAGMWTFVGFLPRGGSVRRRALERVAGLQETVVLYEAPHRLRETLADLASVEGSGRAVCLAREVTKKWEQFLRFSSIAEAVQWHAMDGVEPRGEYTLIMGPVAVLEIDRDDLNAIAGGTIDVVALTECLVQEGIPVSSVARSVAAAAKVPKKLVYTVASRAKERMLIRDEERV